MKGPAGKPPEKRDVLGPEPIITGSVTTAHLDQKPRPFRLRGACPMITGMKRTIGWLAAAVVVTLVFGSLYITFQQSGRRSANVAPAAAAAAQVQLLGSTSFPMVPRIELTPDSGVFVIVYGPDNKPETGTATLHGALPAVPSGVLDAARTSGADIVTWQPEPGLRMAVVARSSAGKVIVAGQSLAPYEATDRLIMVFLALGWLGCVLVLGAGFAASVFLLRRQRHPGVDWRPVT